MTWSWLSGRTRRGRLRPATPAVVSLAVVIALAIAVRPAGSRAQDDGPPDPEPAAADVRVVHGSPDAGPLDLYVDGGLAIVGITFASASDPLALSSGNHRVQVVTSGAGLDQAIVDATFALAAGAAYELAILGSLADLRAGLYPVDRAPLPPGLARFRVVHGSPDIGPADVAVTAGDLLFPTVDYTAATEFADLEAGSYDLEVRYAGTEVAVLLLPGLALEAGLVYAVYAAGQVADGTLQALFVTTPAVVPRVDGRPARIRAGGCDPDDVGETVADLASLTVPAGAAIGRDDVAPAENSFATVAVAFEVLVAADHALAVARSDEEPEVVVACGEIGGRVTNDGALVVGLRPLAGSDLVGIAVLAPNLLDPMATDVSIFLVAGLVPGEGERPSAAVDPDEEPTADAADVAAEPGATPAPTPTEPETAVRPTAVATPG